MVTHSSNTSFLGHIFQILCHTFFKNLISMSHISDFVVTHFLKPHFYIIYFRFCGHTFSKTTFRGHISQICGHTFFQNLIFRSHISDFGVPRISNTSFLGPIFWILRSHIFSILYFSVTYFKFWGHMFF